MELIYICPDMVDTVWSAIEGWVEASLGVDKTHTVSDVKNECKGDCQLWVIKLGGEITGFFISLLNPAPQGKLCYGAWLGGKNLAEWVPEGLKRIERWAKDNECIAFSFIGRQAWQKLLGYDYQGVYYYKNL